MYLLYHYCHLLDKCTTYIYPLGGYITLDKCTCRKSVPADAIGDHLIQIWMADYFDSYTAATGDSLLGKLKIRAHLAGFTDAVLGSL
jgi:hypothetical protein